MLKKTNLLILTFFISLVIFGGIFWGETTAYAQTTGTADGTYDFGGAGDPDSAGTGYTALGDKFKINNGKFLYTNSQESGGITAVIPSEGYQVLNYNLLLYAEGGNVCKTFTFQDMSLTSRGGNLTFQNLRLIFKNCYGDTLREYNLGDSVTGIPNNSVVKLSDVTGHGTWNIRGVSTIQMVFTLLDNGSITAPCFLQLENMTIADVSNQANTAPYAGYVKMNYNGQTYGNTLTGSYEYGDEEGDPEGTSTFQWYRSDGADGANKTAIPGATSTSYTLQAADMWKCISFEVTPIAQSGVSPGDPVESWSELIYGPVITVEFYPAGGSVTPVTQTKRNGYFYSWDANGQPAPLPTPTFENGFRFDGWYTGGNGTGEKVTNDTRISSVTNHILYANWIWETYAVTYDGNSATGGNLPADTGAYHYGDNVVIKDFDASNPLYRTGYSRIGGWNTQADGKGTEYTPLQQLEIQGNMHLYAQWDPNTYNVTLDAQGGTVTPASRTKLFDSYYGKGADGTTSDPLPQPARTGYTFKGWYTQPNGEGSKVTDHTRVSTASDHTLYAYWEANIYTVTFDPGEGGVVYPESLQRRFGLAYLYALDGHTEGIPNAYHGGYQFVGWWTQPGGGSKVEQETILTIASDHTLYAHWQAKNYTVTFDPEGGTVPVASQTKLFDSPYGKASDGVTSETLPVPTKDGYVFGGWWTGDDGTDTLVTDTTSLSIASHHTLHAKWLYDLNPISDLEMNRLYFGYTTGSQEEKTVTISGKTGDEIKNLSVNLSGSDADRFSVTQPKPGTISSVSPSAAFTVRAKDNLPIGTFTATIAVSAENMDESKFTVTQTVSPQPSAGRLVSIVVFDGSGTVSGAKVSINGVSMVTGMDGQAVFLLGNGTYAYRTSKAGYQDTQGEFTVDGSARPACLLLNKQGENLLPDINGGGLILITGNGGYSPGLALSVESVQPGANDISAIKMLNGNYEVISLFDINLLASSHIIEPNSPITIGILLPAGMEGKTLKVVRVNDDGTTVEFETKVVGNMLFFTTDHLSRYAVVSVNSPQPSPANIPAVNPAGGSPKTGDRFPILLWILLMAGSLAGGILALRLKKHAK